MGAAVVLSFLSALLGIEGSEVCSLRSSRDLVCHQAAGWEAVQQAATSINTSLRYLRIVEGLPFGLNTGAFDGFTTQRLIINGTDLLYIADDAFRGQEHHLEYMRLEHAHLLDVPSAAFQGLYKLKTLSLADNSITVIASHSFSGLDYLGHLILRNNRLVTLEEGAFPTHLTTLQLSHNSLSTLNGTVRYMPRLEWLLLSFNRIYTLAGELEGLYHLQYLAAEENEIKSLDLSLHHLQRLDYLNLAYNHLESIEEGLHGLTHLTYLNLSYNSIRLLDYDEFTSLVSLSTLDLSGNKLTYLRGALRPLENLRYLNLSHNRLISFSRRDLRGLSALKELDVSHNQLVSLDGAFHPHGPPLEVLRASHNLISELHGALKPISSTLRSLDLSSNQLVTLAKYDLNKTDNLVDIFLHDNPWNCTRHLAHVLQEIRRSVSVSTGLEDCESI